MFESVCSLSRYRRRYKFAGYRPEARYVFARALSTLVPIDINLSRLKQIHSSKVRFMDSQKSLNRSLLYLCFLRRLGLTGAVTASRCNQNLRYVTLFKYRAIPAESIFNYRIIPNLAINIQSSIFNITRFLKFIMHMTTLTPTSLCRLAWGWISISNTCASARLPAYCVFRSNHPMPSFTSGYRFASRAAPGILIIYLIS